MRYTVPDAKRVRVIIDTDAACEADDPFAIAHALMSPKLIVEGIIATHFREPGSTRASYDEIRTVLDAMYLNVPVYMGQSGPLDETDGVLSPGAEFIIRQALAPNDRPLYVLCQGAVTNVAAALRAHPAISRRMTVIWIGTHGAGNRKPPFREFNAGNDVTAANELLESGTDIWLIPSGVYTTMHAGLAELELKVAPCGRIGRHLYENMVRYNQSNRAGWTQGESWSLGDSPAVAAVLNPGCGTWELLPAPHIEADTASTFRPDNPVIRVYRDMDSRYVLEDFFAKLRLREDY